MIAGRWLTLAALLAAMAPLDARGAGGEPGPPEAVLGRLVVEIGDRLDGSVERLHFVEGPRRGERLRLRFEGEPPGRLRSGDTVRARGRRQGDALLLAADGADSGIEVVTPAAPARVGGEQRTLVMVADYSDDTVPCSLDEVRDRMFTDPALGSVAEYYADTSFGQLWLTGEVVGGYALDVTSTDACRPYDWAVAIEAQAQADGVDVDAYERKIYVLPRSLTCGYAGLASVGDTPSRAWVFRCDLDDTFAHEFGHNLGMNHASTPTSQYGDTSDIMSLGGFNLRQPNAPHKEQLGWLEPQQVALVTGNGIYDIAPLELHGSESSLPTVLKIAKPDTGEHYYLSYRQPIAFDVNLQYYDRDRLHVHRYAGTGGRTFLLAKLAPGESFVDAVNEVSVTSQEIAGEAHTLRVEFGVAEPSPACSDGLDNDGDGAIDHGLDPGCEHAADTSEHSPLHVCDDGLDNDGDGRVDFPADPQCLSPIGRAERATRCGLGFELALLLLPLAARAGRRKPVA